MRLALDTFNYLIDSCNFTRAMWEYLENNKIPLDNKDLLRWQWVQAISSLDKFIHDIVRIGMIEIFCGMRNPTPKYKDFRVNLETAILMMTSSNADQIKIIEQNIVLQNGYKSFQRPKNISDALAYIWNENNKWKKITDKMSGMLHENDVKTKLNNIVIRRDQIVHEGDCPNSSVVPIVRQTVNITDVEEIINFIKEVAEAIYNCVI